VLPSERARANDRHRIRPVTVKVLKCEDCHREHEYSPWLRRCPRCGSLSLKVVHVRD
jgi:Zn finger protein HypA/HybF involved in hydrogenase expression